MFALKVSGKLNMTSLLAVSKLKFKLERQKKTVDIGLNPKVLIGLSRFKKKLGMRSSIESTPRDEEHDDDPNRMRFITEIFFFIINELFSVRSLAAAGKFRSRRYKTDKNTSRQKLGAFLSWFGGSQALDRSIMILSDCQPSLSISEKAFLSMFYFQLFPPSQVLYF